VFTGIVEATGIIRARNAAGGGATLLIEAEGIVPGLKTGDSIAVNGACLTVVEIGARDFVCDLSAETLRRTTLGKVREGISVNLERPLAIGARLGGHFVLGHVDGIGRLVSAVSIGEGMEMEFSVPAELERYLVAKGSVAIDGISLTIAQLRASGFNVAVIPYTYRVTNLHQLRPGDAVNLEGDVLAKYFERFFQLGLMPERKPERKLTVEELKEQGY
jgi:riboflavin synthase